MKQEMHDSRVHDFPELQIGYPERNDVRNPNFERERIHVDLEKLELKRTTADGLTREIIRQRSYSHNQ
jgi:hypothetical protein